MMMAGAAMAPVAQAPAGDGNFGGDSDLPQTFPQRVSLYLLAYE